MDTPRKPQRAVKTFQVIFRYGEDEYRVIALDTDTAEPGKAFQLCKQTGDERTYEVRVAATGPQCDCKGFLFKGRCKHLVMLRKARMLD